MKRLLILVIIVTMIVGCASPRDIYLDYSYHNVVEGSRIDGLVTFLNEYPDSPYRDQAFDDICNIVIEENMSTEQIDRIIKRVEGFSLYGHLLDRYKKQDAIEHNDNQSLDKLESWYNEFKLNEYNLSSRDSSNYVSLIRNFIGEFVLDSIRKVSDKTDISTIEGSLSLVRRVKESYIIEPMTADLYGPRREHRQRELIYFYDSYIFDLRLLIAQNENDVDVYDKLLNDYKYNESVAGNSKIAFAELVDANITKLWLLNKNKILLSSDENEKILSLSNTISNIPKEYIPLEKDYFYMVFDSLLYQYKNNPLYLPKYGEGSNFLIHLVDYNCELASHNNKALSTYLHPEVDELDRVVTLKKLFVENEHYLEAAVLSHLRGYAFLRLTVGEIPFDEVTSDLIIQKSSDETVAKLKEYFSTQDKSKLTDISLTTFANYIYDEINFLVRLLSVDKQQYNTKNYILLKLEHWSKLLKAFSDEDVKILKKYQRNETDSKLRNIAAKIISNNSNYNKTIKSSDILKKLSD